MKYVNNNKADPLGGVCALKQVCGKLPEPFVGSKLVSKWANGGSTKNISFNKQTTFLEAMI